MKKILLALLCVSLSLGTSLALMKPVGDINKAKGGEKWLWLRMYLYRTRTWTTPAHIHMVLYLENRDRLLAEERSMAGEKKMTGTWKVDPDRGFITFDLPGRISGKKKYRSLHVFYDANCLETGCRIVFFTGKEFQKKDDFGDYAESKDHLVLTPTR